MVRRGTQTTKYTSPEPTVNPLVWGNWVTDGRDMWSAEASEGNKWLKAELWPTGDSDQEVTYQRISMIARFALGSRFFCYYQPAATGISDVSATYYPEQLPVDKVLGSMTVKAHEGWKWGRKADNLGSASGMNWNTQALVSGMVDMTAACLVVAGTAGPAEPIVIIAEGIAVFAKWFIGVEWPQDESPGQIEKRQRRYHIDYAMKTTETTELSNNDNTVTTSVATIGNVPLAICNACPIVPMRMYLYQSTAGVGCNQVNTQAIDGRWQFVTLWLTPDGADADALYKVEVKRP